MPSIAVASLPVRELFPGLRARLVHTDRQTHSWVEVDASAAFPEHQHPHEQIVSVIDGELELVVDGTVHRLTPGVVFVTAFDEHALRAFEVHALDYVVKPFGRPRFGAAVGLEPAGFVAVSAGFVGVGLAVAVSELFVGAGEDSLVGGAMVAVGEGMPASLPPWLTATAATTMIPAAAAPMTARTPQGGLPFGGGGSGDDGSGAACGGSTGCPGAGGAPGGVRGSGSTIGGRNL